jgi:hypothetical protein
MAIEVAAQRLELGVVVLVSPPGQDEQVEALLVRDIDRTDTTDWCTRDQQDFGRSRAFRRLSTPS